MSQAPFVVLETNSQLSEAVVELVPEMVPTKALSWNGGKVSVSLRNVTDHTVKLRHRMLIERVSSATPVPLPEMTERLEGELHP